MYERNPYPRYKVQGETLYWHRGVAEVELDRPLKPGEVIHHIDGDQWNADPSNLIVFSSQRAHMIYEHWQRRGGHRGLWSIDELLEHYGEYMIRLE
jgi:hypothetical protein